MPKIKHGKVPDEPHGGGHSKGIPLIKPCLWSLPTSPVEVGALIIGLQKRILTGGPGQYRWKYLFRCTWDESQVNVEIHQILETKTYQYRTNTYPNNLTELYTKLRRQVTNNTLSKPPFSLCCIFNCSLCYESAILWTLLTYYCKCLLVNHPANSCQNERDQLIGWSTSPAPYYPFTHQCIHVAWNCLVWIQGYLSIRSTKTDFLKTPLERKPIFFI